MSDNTTLNPGAGGDTARSLQRGGAAGPKTQVVALDVGGEAGEQLASHDNPMPVSLTARVLQMLSALANPLWIEPSTSRMRVVLDGGGAQALGSVGTVTNQTNIGGLPASGLVHDQMHATWAASVRRCVS